MTVASPPDLLRLLAVPAFAWIAWRDHRTRRVPSRAWYPLAALGVALLAWEATVALSGPPFERRLLAVQVGVSLLLVPLAYAFYRLGGFGGADAKAFMTIAVLFPTYPVYRLGAVALPIERPPLPVFSLTVVTDAVLVGALYPVALAARNALAGRASPAMFVGRPVRWDELEGVHGKLLEDAGGVTLSGLDLDALRMYLRWRGVRIAEIRERPDELRDPATLPDDPDPPGDGAVGVRGDGGRAGRPPERGEGADRDRPGGSPDGLDDPWGAAAFLGSIEGSAYGTTPEGLRSGLDLIAEEEVVWVSPGIPFIVPLFLGLVVALTYGDVLYAALEALGAA